MDNSIFLIFYYGVSLLLVLVMMRGIDSRRYKAIGVLFAITFSYFLCSYLGLLKRFGFEMIPVGIAFILYVIARIRGDNQHLLNEIFLIFLPFITIVRLLFKVLHLNGWNELGLYCMLVVFVTIVYVLVFYLRKRTVGPIRQPLEINGLFAIVLIPTLL